MSIDIAAAADFVHANARLVDRHRLAVLLHDAPATPVIEAVRAYRNADGGFGHALEPDVRCPDSQPAATLAALHLLAEADALSDPMVADAATWISGIANADGGVPTVLPSAADHPRAPFMEPSAESGFLTFALAGRLWQAGSDHPWLTRATRWCWAALEAPGEMGGYTVKYALEFLDAVPDDGRAAASVERLRPALEPDGSVPVSGGIEGERIPPLDLSPLPGAASRALFTEEQVEADLDRLEGGQLDDGGWDFDFLHWSAGQSVEWRGATTVEALHTLRVHGRLNASREGSEVRR
jgi:hypothetical protein